jgi:hypothetical protein
MEQKVKALYYIKDLRTDKIIYIGQTTNFKRRKQDHFGDKKTSIDAYMFEEGRDNFSMKIFEDIDVNNYSDDDLRSKEQELIEYYDTINNGLNKNRSGNILIDDVKKYHREYMREYNKTEKQKQYQRDYENSEKRKQYLKKHQSTEHYREYQRDYMREYRKRKNQQKLASDSSL